MKGYNYSNTRYTPGGNVESKFREQVRDILNLDWSATNEKIYEELRRLKGIEARVKVMADRVFGDEIGDARVDVSC